ncbi:MAG TPA: DoxX family protein [Candidatus Marinimicrobia bacterium]|nr:DoxX family protein [Candidatus Neomarinimicrobiota bacterium]
MINKFLDTDCSHCKKPVMMLMRLFLAFIFIKAGMGKLPIVAGEGLTNSLPLFLVYLVALFEILGGLFMLIGIKYEALTRLGALMIGIVMIGAAYMHYCVWGDPFGSKDVMYPLSLLLITLVFITDE